MKKNESLSDLPVSDLLKIYEEAAAAHGKAIEGANSRAANKNFDITVNVYRELKGRGSEAQRQLLQLLSSSDPNVQCAVAAHALEFAADIAEPVLKKLRRVRNGVVALTAEMTLQEWRKGNLRFP